MPAGDAIAAVATPIARILGLDCIDKETGQLKANTPCDQRKSNLNRRFENVNPLA